MRCAMAGADGTPYHDGLFVFDFYFSESYPRVPPEAHYHSYGLRVNPNLYENGKVCLSLLNTWSGKGSEVSGDADRPPGPAVAPATLVECKIRGKEAQGIPPGAPPAQHPRRIKRKSGKMGERRVQTHVSHRDL